MFQQLFAEAFVSGTMEGFFKLISYFQTQSEPAYCGLASISMVLNALAIDPGRKWKGPWRWFDESMLDCCEPLEKIKDKGITFAKVTCLAICNGATVEAFRTNQCAIDEFRQCVIACTSSEGCHVITSYHRNTFQQSCKHDSWVSTAKRLIEDVPVLLSSDDVKDVQAVLSVIFASCPTNSREFIKIFSKFGEKRTILQEEVLTQVKETELFKHMQEWLSSRSSHCTNIASMGDKSILLDNASSDTCLDANADNCLNTNGDIPSLRASGTTVTGGREKEMNMLVPCSAAIHCSSSDPANFVETQYGRSDSLTVLLLALPPHTWLGVKDKKLFGEICTLVSSDCLPPLLQEEVLYLRKQLHFLKKCLDDQLGAPSFT
ncbi:hypothetical protein IFM89_018046 [Coptis chinensis]|uniref:glutathione gamma-glutamylcysteinyltransferase n=1 Tax=Coptis chinensis TaxID=261450 RepID=A0A835HWL8_9MAGN|nr:hypothetical protein IFM89_018046 [Coptis chinensis]